MANSFNEQYSEWLERYGASPLIFFAGTEALPAPAFPDNELAAIWSGGVPILGSIFSFFELDAVKKDLTSRFKVRTARMRELLKDFDWYVEVQKHPVRKGPLMWWANVLGAPDAEAAAFMLDAAEAFSAADRHAANGAVPQFMRQYWRAHRAIDRFNGRRITRARAKIDEGGIGLGDIVRDSIVNAPDVFGDAVGRIGGAVGNVAGETVGSAVEGFASQIKVAGLFGIAGLGVVIFLLTR